MKFLCDRCKTRYSIGDDRVRGKILKIRCKNCANVITVREGMTDADAAAENGAPRRNKTTTSSPPISSAQPAPANGSNGSALGAAFASAMSAKPPPALEEEWYVSIDGEQEGPFSLSDAQRWVAGKPFEAELHCWSEGFDDWLPVDKVSHFRGLRKKPLPHPAAAVASPPPLPRLGGIKPIIPQDELTPKPLFAATMAALEKNAPHPAAPSPGVGLPSLGTTLRGQVPAPATPASTRGTPSAGHAPIQARTNGAGLASSALGRATPVPSIANNPARVTTTPGLTAKAGLGSIPPTGVFDDSDTAGKTEIEAPPFEEEAFARPVAAASRPAAAPRADSDGDLDIGEVSRVVKLADIVPTKQPRRDVTGPVARRSGWIPQAQLDRLTASVPKMDMPADGQVRHPTGALNVMPASDLAAPPIATHHRRQLVILLSVAIILLGVAGVVLWKILDDDDTPESQLSRVEDHNYYRPDTPRPMIPGTSVPVPVPTQPPRPPRRPGGGQTVQTPRPPIEDETPGTNKLDPAEVEQMALKQSSSTNFCYTRALRGKGAIELADLKKITATLTVDREGVVSSSQLSDHNDDALGSCINRVIRGWHFRPASGGTFRITLQFVNI